jgi:hypothetical protein
VTKRSRESACMVRFWAVHESQYKWFPIAFPKPKVRMVQAVRRLRVCG